jgi:hypothetical protein
MQHYLQLTQALSWLRRRLGRELAVLKRQLFKNEQEDA